MPAIILEGADGIGKTTVFRLLADRIPLCETVKLSGGPKGTGPEYQRKKFEFFARYFALADKNTLLLDRGTTSERVYGPLRGFSREDLSYLDAVERQMNDADVSLFVLTAQPVAIAQRMTAKQGQNPNEAHASVEKVLDIQECYRQVLQTTNCLLKTRVIDTTYLSPEEVVDEILRRARPDIWESGVGV